MPGFDGTGPTGAGPMTGRGMGSCGCGFGGRFGRRNRRGLGRFFGGWGSQSKKDQLEELKAYKQALKEELEMIEEDEKELAKAA